VEVYHCTTFLGLPSLFGKTNEIKKIMKERGWRKSVGNIRPKDSFRGYQSGMWRYDSAKVLGIADEVRDYHAFDRMGIKMLCATWGLNNEAAFRKSGVDPRYIVRDPREIPGKIKEIESAG